ncbi:MAG: transposase [Phycisphaeraceae bacterium]|nr:transposase [Phycisphaeraceae bacterium]
MAAAYSQDLRDRIIRAYKRGMTTSQIVRLFEVSPAWARRVKQRLTESGEAGPRKVGSRGVRKIDHERLAVLVREQPDATLKELRERLGVQCAESAICRVLQKLGWSFKKRQSTRRSRTARMSQNAAKSGRPDKPDSTPAA